MQPMPTDFTITCKADNNFRPRKIRKYTIQNLEWLSLVAHTNKFDLQTQYKGNEMRFCKRRLPVDWWCSTTITAYQFHLRLFHGHLTFPLTLGKVENPVSKRPLTKLLAETTKNREYLTGVDVNIWVIEMWECEMKTLKKANLNIQRYFNIAFIWKNPLYAKSKKIMKELIIEAIKEIVIWLSRVWHWSSQC